ncbi:hypothetical protein K501DRAFT_240030 [Backusella circina FSU 941]|nr:hypothetical protein K501DRAFT_240030 [Backusella circina FSU 941]
MDPNEFPSLQETKMQSSDTSDLSTSWADIAKSNASIDDKKSDTSNDLTASFAQVAGHEKKLLEEFPTPGEANGSGDNSINLSGTGDVLSKTKEGQKNIPDHTQPPHPERSFAAVASNEGFPKPESDANGQSESLSNLPDVKDMLQQPSVNIPPPPPSQSFAKMAAKEIPPEMRPLGDREKDMINSQTTPDPTDFNHDNFPPLAQSNLMAEKNASSAERAVYSEISRFGNMADNEEKKKEAATAKSFADVTGSNLENAPPAAISHVDTHPVYDEDTILRASHKREERKLQQVDDNADVSDITPEMKHIEEKKQSQQQQKSREIQSNSQRNSDDLSQSLDRFDRKHRGKITIFDTMSALYNLGYSWFTIIPTTIIMHLRLSPLSSPHGFPFYYRSLSDLILLPIYTKNLGIALTRKTPMLYQEEPTKLVTQYGHKEGNTQGLGYWDGVKAMRQVENKTPRLGWWQLGLWAVHRLQWTLTYTMLQDPKTGLVTAPTLTSLKIASKKH